MLVRDAMGDWIQIERLHRADSRESLGACCGHCDCDYGYSYSGTTGLRSIRIPGSFCSPACLLAYMRNGGKSS
jgi:hypothetical protein